MADVDEATLDAIHKALNTLAFDVVESSPPLRKCMSVNETHLLGTFSLSCGPGEDEWSEVHIERGYVTRIV